MRLTSSHVELEDEFVRVASDDVADIRASGPADEAYERLTASLWADGGGAAAVLDLVVEGRRELLNFRRVLCLCPWSNCVPSGVRRWVLFEK